ncbi:MAG: thioredoxin [Acutalibacteraceae bacterium]
MVAHLDDKTFRSMISENRVAVVDFWATWCMPCKMMAPVLEQLDDKMASVAVGKIDVDEFPQLAADYHVQSIPNIVIFKNGAVADTLIGVRPYEELEKAVIRASE